MFELVPEGVSFSARGFQVEDEVFHIESQLSQCLLNHAKNSPPTNAAVDDFLHGWGNGVAKLQGKILQSNCELLDLSWAFFYFAEGSNGVGHSGGLNYFELAGCNS